jgi:hypothetical protein
MEQPEAEIPASEKCGLGVVWELENENMVTFVSIVSANPKYYRVYSLLASFTKKQ